jgi:hypothetical protein
VEMPDLRVSEQHVETGLEQAGWLSPDGADILGSYPWYLICGSRNMVLQRYHDAGGTWRCKPNRGRIRIYEAVDANICRWGE